MEIEGRTELAPSEAKVLIEACETGIKRLEARRAEMAETCSGSGSGSGPGPGPWELRRTLSVMNAVRGELERLAA